MKDYSAKDFIDLIDSKFEECVGEVNRIDVKWGTWSREMNLVIREKIANDSPKFSVFGLVFSYWIEISQLLDMLYKCTGLKATLREKKIRKKTESAIALREKILEMG